MEKITQLMIGARGGKNQAIIKAQQKEIEELKVQVARWGSELNIQLGWLKAEKNKTKKLQEELNQCHKDKGFYSEQWELVSKDNTGLLKEFSELQERVKVVDRLDLINFCNNIGEIDFKRVSKDEINIIVDNHLNMLKEVNEQLDKEYKQNLEDHSNF